MTTCGCWESIAISGDLRSRPSCVSRQCGVFLLRRVRRSLDDESAATLVHAFVTSRIDYCNLLLAGAFETVTDELQRVMNAAAPVVSGTRKYDRGLTHLLHAELRWLDVVRYVQTCLDSVQVSA